jgi:hypothetical protein
MDLKELQQEHSHAVIMAKHWNNRVIELENHLVQHKYTKKDEIGDNGVKEEVCQKE